MTMSTTVMASLKHRTCSGQPGGACWEYSPVQGCDGPTVTVRIIQGARIFDATILVCTSTHPRSGAWSIRRLSEDSWRISCSRYGYHVNDMTTPEPFAEGLGIGSVDLLAAPPDVQRDLEAIDDHLARMLNPPPPRRRL